MLDWNAGFAKGSAVLGLVLGAVGAFAQFQPVLLASGLSEPIDLVRDPQQSNRFLILESRLAGAAQVRVLNGSTLLQQPFAVTGAVGPGLTRGGRGIALHPQFSTNGYVFVSYVDSENRLVVDRFQRSATDPNVSDPANFRRVIRIQLATGLNSGGAMRFGADGMLCLAVGDGSGNGDPANTAQSLTRLTGKILRLDINRDDFPNDTNANYGAPLDNPFVGAPGFDEIWSYGWRFPDSLNEDPLVKGGFGGWITPENGSTRQELNWEPVGAAGLNYGWRAFDGTLDTGLGGLNGSAVTPLWEPPGTPGAPWTSAGIYRGLQLGPGAWGRLLWTRTNSNIIQATPIERDVLTREIGAGPTFPLAVIPTGQITRLIQGNFGEIFAFNQSSGEVFALTGQEPYFQVTGTIDLGEVSPIGEPGSIDVFLRRAGSLEVVDRYRIPVVAGQARFSIPVPIGKWNLTCAWETWLRRSFEVNSNGGPFQVDFSLANGDIDADQEVGPSDFALLIGAFGTIPGDPNFLRRADLDRDDEVGPSDFSILAVNFTQVADP